MAPGKGALLGTRNQRLRVPTLSPSLRLVEIHFQAGATVRKVLVALCCWEEEPSVRVRAAALPSG